jgi:hypothetical protein
MVSITERLDPDRWIAEGKSLLDYPILEPSSLQFRLVDVVFGDKREIATHLCQWMARVAEARSPFTEENLRSLWEETRTITATKPMDDVKKDAALTMRDDSVTEEGITFLRGWRD